MCAACFGGHRHVLVVYAVIIDNNNKRFMCAACFRGHRHVLVVYAVINDKNNEKKIPREYRNRNEHYSKPRGNS